ncbi:uncharacterized protein [Apostichopus japonicus]|uniref:uncharacterized protein n=1 Tax=Stichopus japonicus TaxID=307972 RepID=UPI003AB1B933
MKLGVAENVRLQCMLRAAMETRYNQVSTMKCGLLPISQDALICEEAYFLALNCVAACEIQIHAVGLDNVNHLPDEVRDKVGEGTAKDAGGVSETGHKLKVGELEFEAMMRHLDNMIRQERFGDKTHPGPISEVLAGITYGDACRTQVEVEELDTLAQDINGLKYSAQAASILDSDEPSISKGMAQPGLKDNRPLAEWLDWYNANQPDLAAKPNFTTFPLDFKPSPCKPLFFDIALNYIELPSLDEKLEQNKLSSQGGLGGFLHGWWSGGEK